MKKLLLSLLIILSLCAVLVGCSSQKTKIKGASSTPNSSSTVPNSTKSEVSNSTEVEVPSPTNTEKPEIQITDQTEKYQSAKFGLSMEFPSSCKGKYMVEENESGIDVYFKPKQKVDDGMGLLFSIIKKTNDLDEGMYDSISGAKKYYEVNGVTYLVGGPTDVSFPETHPEFKTFLKIKADIPEVLKTLK